jgi:hypothetical protein
MRPFMMASSDSMPRPAAVGVALDLAGRRHVGVAIDAERLDAGRREQGRISTPPEGGVNAVQCV